MQQCMYYFLQIINFVYNMRQNINHSYCVLAEMYVKYVYLLVIHCVLIRFNARVKGIVKL